MSDEKKILDQVSRIRKKYKTETTDERDTELSFIDEVNSLIRRIFNDGHTDVYTALSPQSLADWKKRRFRRFFGRFTKYFSFIKAFYFTLLCAITGFLVSEAITFYAGVGGILSFKTYVKAILTEVSFIFLSGFRAVGALQTFFVGILRASIFALMLFVISSDVTMQGVSQISEIEKIQEQIVFLEKQIEDKDKEIEFYRKKNWGVNTRERIAEKKILVDKLIELKEKQIEGKNEDVSDQIVYQTWGKAAFRVLLLMISVLLTRRLFRF